MKRCGDDLWWVDGSRLIIQYERKRSRLIRGGFLLFTAAASGAWLVARPGEFLSPLLFLVLSLTSGLEQLLGVRRIVLERGEHGQVTWGRGLGTPFFRSERPLAEFTYVRHLTTLRASLLIRRVSRCQRELWEGTMPRRLLMLVALLVLETGCPHAWGRGGTIDEALAKDMREYLSNRNCTLEDEEWWEQCGEDFWSRPGIAQHSCPLECRPPMPKP